MRLPQQIQHALSNLQQAVRQKDHAFSLDATDTTTTAGYRSMSPTVQDEGGRFVLPALLPPYHLYIVWLLFLDKLLHCDLRQLITLWTSRQVVDYSVIDEFVYQSQRPA